jgi:hypothetical protein
MSLKIFKMATKDTFVKDTKIMFMLCSFEIMINGPHDDVIESVNVIWNKYKTLCELYDKMEYIE